MGRFQHRNPELRRPLVYRVEILDGDPDLRPGGVLARLGLCKVEHHVIPRSEVSPGQVVMQGLVSIVPMRLVIQFEAEELPVKLRAAARSAAWTCKLLSRAT